MFNNSTQRLVAVAHGEKEGDIYDSIISTACNRIHILIHILIILLIGRSGELLVLLTVIKLLTNQGPGTGMQALATAAKVTNGKKRWCRVCKLGLTVVNNYPSYCSRRHKFHFYLTTQIFFFVNVVFTTILAKIYLVVTTNKFL